MDLSDAERRAILVHLESIRCIIRGPVGAETPMAGDVVEVAEGYAAAEPAVYRYGGNTFSFLTKQQFAEKYGEPDTDGGLAKQAAETASRGSYRRDHAAGLYD